MTLLDLIHTNRAELDAQPRRRPIGFARPRRDIRPFLCPAWHGPCSRTCFIRHACTTQPEKLMALITRLDEQTAIAIGRHLADT